METMQFEWEKGEQTGSFKVTAFSVKECMEMAEKEIQEFGGEMIDWYSI